MSLKNTFTFLLFLQTSISFAQIKGEYILSSRVDEGSRTLTFNGSNFIDKSTGHINGKYGKGSFKLEKNQLTLTYFSIKNKDSSLYKIDSEKLLYGYTSIFAHVSSDKTPQNGAAIILRDSKFEPLFSANTLNNGTASFTINKSENVKFLTVDFIGYNRAVIPFNVFAGKRSDIFVELKYQNTFIEPPHTDVYQVVQFDEKTIKLFDSNKRELVFKKSN